VRIAVVAGPPASGKTALLLHALERVRAKGLVAGVFKLDAVDASDGELYSARGWPSMSVCAGDVCPDHEAMVRLGDAWNWARGVGLDLLVMETAGLCDRCSPFLRRALAICVVSGMGSLAAPEKLKTLVGCADTVVLARAELLGPTERHILMRRLETLNPEARRHWVNGLTGEGCDGVAAELLGAPDIRLLDIEALRATLPTGYCHFCQGGSVGT